LGKGTLGVEMDNYYLSAAADAALRHHLPDVRFADAAVWGLEFTESMVIGKAGAALLSNYPRPLLVKD